jgi:hypothetical protein
MCIAVIASSLLRRPDLEHPERRASKFMPSIGEFQGGLEIPNGA